jgi:hypothetical protein
MNNDREALGQERTQDFADKVLDFSYLADVITVMIDDSMREDEDNNQKSDDSNFWFTYDKKFRAAVNSSDKGRSLVSFFNEMEDYQICKILDSLSKVSRNDGNKNLRESLNWRLGRMVSLDGVGKKEYLESLRNNINKRKIGSDDNLFGIVFMELIERFGDDNPQFYEYFVGEQGITLLRNLLAGRVDLEDYKLGYLRLAVAHKLWEFANSKSDQSLAEVGVDSRV